MELKIFNWNISYMKSIENKIDYLMNIIDNFNNEEKIIFVLEEVKPSDTQYIRKNLDNFCFINSVNIREKGEFEGKNRELGILIGYSSNLILNSYNLLERTLFPERTLHAKFSYDDYKFGIVGFHSLTGVGYKKAKSAQFASIAEYIYRNESEIDFLCFDANEPKIDHHDISKIKFHSQKGDKGKSASLILGKNKVHKLNDAYRKFISQKSDILKQKIKEQEKSENIVKTPLETSYKISANNKRRYDYIFCSNNWKIINIEYRLNNAIKSGSDHAIVIGEFKTK